MLAKMQNTFRTIGRHFHGLKVSQASRFNFQERTELTWARVLESYNKIPEAYRDFFAPFSNETEFPYAVFTPAFETLGYKITEKVVCVLDGEIDVLERIGKNVSVVRYPLSGINNVEASRMLLDSRVKISGMTREGTLTSSIARFSSATDYIFAPILRRIRLGSRPSREGRQNKEAEQFDRWINLNFKFMNMARQSLLGSEKVMHSMLQPEIRASIFTFLGRAYSRMVAPTHAIILTDRELIVIREDAQHSRKDRYGGIWQYIPLNKVRALDITTGNGGLLALTIDMVTGECFEYLFQASMKAELDELLFQFKPLTAA